MERRDDADRMREVMRDQHRERIMAQIERDRAREASEFDKLQQQREAKKAIRYFKLHGSEFFSVFFVRLLDYKSKLYANRRENQIKKTKYLITFKR